MDVYSLNKSHGAYSAGTQVIIEERDGDNVKVMLRFPPYESFWVHEDFLTKLRERSK